MLRAECKIRSGLTLLTTSSPSRSMASELGLQICCFTLIALLLSVEFWLVQSMLHCSRCLCDDAVAVACFRRPSSAPAQVLEAQAPVLGACNQVLIHWTVFHLTNDHFVSASTQTSCVIQNGKKTTITRFVLFRLYYFPLTLPMQHHKEWASDLGED